MSAVKPLARIHRPPRSAMQSARGNSQDWVLEYAPTPQVLDPLMGWIGRGDTRAQLRLRFPTEEAAIAYAEARGISYEVEKQRPAKPIKPKVYADNFRYGRMENWSH
jgi:hypothetical protein